MAIGATDFAEYFAAALYICIIEVACGRHSQTAVPYHEVDIIFVAHLGWQSVTTQVVVDVGSYVAGLVPLGEV